MTKFLCLLGIHKPKLKQHCYPSMDAVLITRIRYLTTCQRCGKTLQDVKVKLRENRMIIDN